MDAFWPLADATGLAGLVWLVGLEVGGNTASARDMGKTLVNKTSSSIFKNMNPMFDKFSINYGLIFLNRGAI